MWFRKQPMSTTTLTKHPKLVNRGPGLNSQLIGHMCDCHQPQLVESGSTMSPGERTEQEQGKQHTKTNTQDFDIGSNIPMLALIPPTPPGVLEQQLLSLQHNKGPSWETALMSGLH